MTPPERLTLKSIASDFIRDFSQADKGLWGAAIQLTIQPRRVLDTFLYKNRRQFSRPTRYLIFCLSVAAFQFIAVQWRYGVSVIEYNETVEADPDTYQGPLVAFAQGFASAGEDTTVSIKKLAGYESYALVILIPAYAFIYFFLFPARGLNYAESLAGAVYLHAHYILVTGLVSLPFLAFSDIADFAVAKNWIINFALVLLFVSVFRMFLASRKDIVWMAPKLLLLAVWAIAPFVILAIIVTKIMSLILPEMAQIPHGLFLFLILFLLAVTLLSSRVLLAFRSRWPGWRVWVPTVLVVLGVYTMLAIGWM